MRFLVICDVDNTIADVSKEAASAGSEPSRLDREKYSYWVATMTKNLANVPPIVGVVETVRHLYRGGAEVVYLTSREEVHRSSTQSWLNKNGMPPGQLLMRGFNDWRETSDLKESHIKIYLQKFAGIVMTLDDDPTGELEAVYRRLGITHLKITNGLSAWEDKKAGAA